MAVQLLYAGILWPRLKSAAILRELRIKCGSEYMDFLSVNCRKNEKTTGFIDAAAIAAMKPGMIIVNPSAAEIIDKSALLEEYRKPTGARHIAATILDMPYGGRRDAEAFAADPDNRTLKTYGVLFTPRIAGYTVETRAHGMKQLASQVQHTLQGGAASAFDKEQLTRDIIELAQQAGEKAIRMRDAGLTVEYDASKSPSTDADKMAADWIREGLIRKGYHFRYSGEEQHPTQSGTGNVEVVIDGIDGTRNFRDGNYGWCNSVAVKENGETIIGVVHDPKCQETFWAIKDAGAHCQDRHGEKNLTVPANQPKDFSFSIGSFFVQKSAAIKQKLIEDIKNIGGHGREWGSVALSLCAVARGGLGAFIQGDSKLHDHIAGMLIAQEAGAHVTTSLGSQVGCSDIIATHPTIGSQIDAIYANRVAAISLLRGGPN